MILRDMTGIYTIGSGLCSIRLHNSSLLGDPKGRAEPGLTLIQTRGAGLRASAQNPTQPGPSRSLVNIL
jgi:hypothetical protein